MGGGDALEQPLPLVGHGVAHGIQAYSAVAGVRGAFQQLHRLHHMGMAANNDIHAHVAKVLGDLLLAGVGFQLVFLAPVEVDHDGLGPVGLHQLHLGA